jgi:hypothetical protein
MMQFSNIESSHLRHSDELASVRFYPKQHDLIHLIDCLSVDVCKVLLQVVQLSTMIQSNTSIRSAKCI